MSKKTRELVLDLTEVKESGFYLLKQEREITAQESLRLRQEWARMRNTTGSTAMLLFMPPGLSIEEMTTAHLQALHKQISHALQKRGELDAQVQGEARSC